MRNSNRTLGTAGYSLLETLTVLVMVGILGSMAAPSLTEYMHRQKARGALDQLASDVAFARMAAVRSGQRAVVRFSGASDYRVEHWVGGETAVRSVGLSNDYAGVVLLPPSAALEFNSRGLLVTDPGDGYIVVSLGGTRDSVMITPAGRLYREF